MARTIVALDPLTGARGLVVEVHADLDTPSPEVVQSFRERLFLRNVRVGLLVTRARTLVLRDTLSRVDSQENKYELHELDTVDLFTAAKVRLPVARTDESFTEQVVRMLEAVGSSWYTFLHPSAVSAMVPDVVGNLAEANLEEWDGLLDRHDAAE